MVVTLEAPSAVSVGLCLVHAACDKRPWLEGLNVEMDWPMSGKPRLLYLDNAAEFKSEALRRGCEQHGIRLDYRPPGQPHYGGIVGTDHRHGDADDPRRSARGRPSPIPTSAGIRFREDGHPDTARAGALAHIGGRHRYASSVHNGLVATAGRGAGPKPSSALACRPSLPAATAFWSISCPVIRRTLTRTGFVIDHIHFYADALKPWIARRDRLPAFLIRRDPRDISRIWVLDPEGQHYLKSTTAPCPIRPSPYGNNARRWPITAARARTGGRVSAVPHDRADARNRDHRAESHAQGAARR